MAAKNNKDTGKTGDVNINARIKQIRTALRLSQAKFCEGIFLTAGHYAEIELGNRRVNERIIKLIAVIYGVNERFLKVGEGAMFDKSPDLKLEKLISIFQELPPDFQDYLMQQIEGLKKLRKKDY
ncbi:MAG: helix-turn-helix domain-containing protein [Spirochaetia bacterium]|jgi:transcriptional regulator with XRE-family HTH domain|nr:helix-turn-helix domain-containing protein [Spirochaetia bacterium]